MFHYQEEQWKKKALYPADAPEYMNGFTNVVFCALAVYFVFLFCPCVANCLP
jgi:hypothetical protein